MHTCPECHDELEQFRSEDGTSLRCPTCRGEAVTAFRMKKRVGGILTDSMTQLATAYKTKSRLRCTVCERRMLMIPMAAGDEKFELEHCQNCAMFWFAEGELQKLPTNRAGEIPGISNPDQIVRETAAIAEVRQIRDLSEAGEPAETWKYVVGLLGLPVEYNHSSQNQPLATWSIAAVCTIVFLITLTYPGSLIWQLGFIPDHAMRYGGLNLLTSFFTHGDWMHLLGNMYFLCVFGDNVEERLGLRKYLLMLISGALAGILLHSLIDPRSSVPLIGASAGISAIIVYYALQFPHERLGFLLWYWWQIHWVSISAIWCLGLWLAWQLVLTGMQTQGMSEVSALGHLGGALAGAAFWWYFEKRNSEEKNPQFNRIQTVFK